MPIVRRLLRALRRPRVAAEPLPGDGWLTDQRIWELTQADAFVAVFPFHTADWPGLPMAIRPNPAAEIGAN